MRQDYFRSSHLIVSLREDGSVYGEVFYFAAREAYYAFQSFIRMNRFFNRKSQGLSTFWMQLNIGSIRELRL